LISLAISRRVSGGNLLYRVLARGIIIYELDLVIPFAEGEPTYFYQSNHTIKHAAVYAETGIARSTLANRRFVAEVKIFQSIAANAFLQRLTRGYRRFG
jgi:hypothetical protein